VKDLHGINPLLDQKKYNGKKVAEEHVLMRLHDAMLCRPRTWLNDAVIQDYSFFLNKVANESEASVLFLSPVQTKRLMQSQDPAKELFSISSRDEHKSTLQTLSLKFDRVVFPINKYQMHWAVAVLWAGNNVNNEANATEVCTDDSSGTNSQKPITKVVTSYDSFNEEIHRPTTSCDRHWATNRYPKEGRCPHQPDGFECGVLTCWNMEKLLEVPDGGAIEYDYCLVERSISDPLSHLRLRQSVSGRFVK
jgi:Ulp1 family protease